MAELAKLRSKRGNIKQKLTRFKQYYESINKDEITDAIINQLQARLDKITPIYEEFNEIQFEIELTTCEEGAEVISDNNLREEFELTYFALIGDIQALCNKFNTAGSSTSGSVVRSNNDSSNRAASHNLGLGVTSSHSLVKLPPIRLPTFNGKYSDWLEFKDAFVALVDSDNSLSDIQKFYYLRSSLEKEVLEIIKSLDVSASNYNEAWKFLIERFENKKLIVHNHIRAIFEYPMLIKESYSDIRNLFDTISKHLKCLKNLGEGTESWDRLMIYIMSNKFDPTTRREWETYKYPGDLPTMKDLNNFLKLKCEILEKLENSEINRGQITNQKSGRFYKRHGQGNSLSVTGQESELQRNKCYYCKQDHGIFKCSAFLKLKIEDRTEEIKRLKLCLNCFRESHPSWKCQKAKCFKCKKAHNSLLHSDNYNKNNTLTGQDNHTKPDNDGANSALPPDNSQSAVAVGSMLIDDENAKKQSESGVAGSLLSNNLSRVSQVLLSTAMIKINNGEKSITVRCLLDSGSTSNFISMEVCKKLNLQPSKIDYTIKGIGQNVTNINSQVKISINSCTSNFNTNINCLVLQRITDRLPLFSFNKNILPIPANLCLADPNYNISNEIDVLLGSDVFWSIIKAGQVRLGKNMPILQETELGYVIAGNLYSNPVNNHVLLNCHAIVNSHCSVDEKIIKFWEIEEISSKELIMSEAEKYCERYFEETTERDSSGRFIVRIPFKNNLNKLGSSCDMAANRFNLLERKLNKNIDLKSDVTAFMTEYLTLGHMSKLDNDRDEGYFMPYHAIIKDSLTTSCRVVFDASARTTSGISLNDVQFVGPTLQQDVFSILARFRSYEFVMTGDVSKMYRQILINKDDKKYQKIFWRDQQEKELNVYQLNTVTYGCSSSPYLAVKCLFQVANENENNFPLASKIIKRDFYMDDVLTGANSVTELLKIQSEIVSILASAGFELRKFLCNNKDILNKFQVNRDLEVNILNIGENQQNKTLGIYWDSNNDFIKYKVDTTNKQNFERTTKRTVLSLICQIFDPLGLVSPIVLVAKVLIQELWKLKLSWDEDIPSNLLKNWVTFYNDLSNISELKIPRHAMFSNYIKIEMHGFCDASEKAFGACIYLRCITSSGNYYLNLLCAKSRVAPLKQLSLPRLELSSAVLLSNLTKKIKESLEIKFDDIYYWTDSMITLYWITSEPTRWKTFVANRVSEIRTLTDYTSWNHVKSEANPADLISRGSSFKNLRDSELWWHGPEFLKLDKSKWNLLEINIKVSEIPEQKSVSCLSVKRSTELDTLLTKFSSLKKTLRVLAYILRFISNIKLKGQHVSERQYGALIPNELDNSLNLIIKNVQIECFSQEYNALINKREIAKNSKILSLNPFLQNQIIRVGGRIKNSHQSFEKRHPIILPKDHVVTDHLLRHEHERLLHCGVQNLLYSIREKYWPISGRNSCKNIIRKCIKCFRVNPKDSTYLMGDLPDVRVNTFSVFSNVGTDFGGPFYLKDRSTRNPKLVKAYICLFICMSTKAVHIELVSGLTTDAFLAAFNRFISRRGKPTNVYSDNGSNYVGANNEISNIYKFFEDNSEYIANQLVNDKIKWHFIPARSPSFGGIWEAGIKSCKGHMKRVIGERTLTFEEFGTILTQIESILNSRPLCPITNDPDDISALTPGHFLIGRPLTRLPEYNLTELSENRLSKWQLLQSIVQHYWARWQREYLSELQTRTKWKQNSQSLMKIGTTTLLRCIGRWEELSIYIQERTVSSA